MLWLDSVYEEPQALQSIEYPKLWLRMADGVCPKEDVSFWMHFRLAEPKKEVDTLVLDKTPGYEISSFGGPWHHKQEQDLQGRAGHEKGTPEIAVGCRHLCRLESWTTVGTTCQQRWSAWRCTGTCVANM